MGGYLKKRSQWLGPDYYEGEIDGKYTTVTPRTDWLGTPYLEIDTEADSPHEFKREGTNGPGGYSKPNWFEKVILIGLCLTILIPLALVGLGMLALPGVAWDVLFDNAYGHTTETTITIICAEIGGILSFFIACSICKAKSPISPKLLVLGPIVSAILLGGCNTLFPWLFQGSVYASNLENFFSAGFVGLLLSIIPSVIGAAIGFFAAKRALKLEKERKNAQQNKKRINP